MIEDNLLFDEFEEIESYGKLEAPGFKTFLTRLNVYLGRDPNMEELDKEEQYIFIGDSNKISKRHAKISWNNFKGEWEIEVLSKNKAIVNGITLKKLDHPITLKPCSSIQINKNKFYFFPAVNM